MSLNARDQQALDGIADSLAGSAPKLAAMLATFTRLTSGEEMPAGEAVTAARPDTRGVRRLRQPGFQRAVPMPRAARPPDVLAGLYRGTI